MPFKVSKSFVINVDVGRAYDLTRNFFLTLGYNEQSAIRPTLLVLKKRRSFQGSGSSKTEKYLIILTVSFTPIGNLQIYSTSLLTVRLNYDVKVSGGMATSSDRAKLAREVEKLRYRLASAPELKQRFDVAMHRCENCDTPLESDATFCRRCGQAAKPTSIPVNMKEREDVITRGSEVGFEPNRVRTGCRSVDELLYGGIPEKYAVILTSPSCDEKDLLVTRFLREGVKNGEATLFITTDLNRVLDLISEHPSIFSAVLCNPQVDLIAPDNRPNILKVNAADNISGINIALVSAVGKISGESNRSRRIVLGNVSDVLLALRAQTTRKWLLDLTSKLKVNGFTILATLNPEMHPKEDTHAIVDLFDGHIDLYAKESPQSSQLYVRVRKMYSKKCSKKEILLAREMLID